MIKRLAILFLVCGALRAHAGDSTGGGGTSGGINATKLQNYEISPFAPSGEATQTLLWKDSIKQWQASTLAPGGVTAISITTTNGISGSSSGGATPALTLALGAITPSTVTIGGGSAITSSGAGGALGSAAFTASTAYDISGAAAAITLSGLGGVPTTRTVNSKALSGNITLGASDVGADASGAAAAITLAGLGGVPTTTTVNGHALSSNVTVAVGDITSAASTASSLAQFASTTSAQLRGVLSDELGTGAALFDGATPTSFTLTNATGLPIAGLTASTSTAIGVGSIELGHASDTTITRTGAGAIAVEGTAVLLSGGALGTPSSGTLTNATGLPISGTTGYGTGIATFLATPSSANLASAVTDETGTGALVFGTAPAFTTSATVGLGATAAPTAFTVGDTSTSSPRGIMSWQSNTGTDGARLHLRKSRGTFASPTTVVSGDTLGRVVATGYDGASFLEMGSINILSTGTIATSRVPTQMVFQTATDAAPSVLTTALTLGADQSATFAGTLATASHGITDASLSANVPLLNAANTFTAAQTNSTNGALSTPPMKYSGTWITGGSATTTTPQLLVEPSGTTSTTWSTSGTGIGVNGASGFGGNLLDIKMNNSTIMRVDSTHVVITTGGLTVSGGGAAITGGITDSGTTDSTTSTTGSLKTAGGLGVAKAVNVGTTLNVTGVSTLAGGGTSTTATAGDNTTQIATTAFVKAAVPTSTYRVLLHASGVKSQTQVASTNVFYPSAVTTIASGGTVTGSLPPDTIYIAAADNPSVNGAATTLRIRGIVVTNATAPTSDFTLGLYPVTKAASSGDANNSIYTVGTVVSGSTALISAPSADTLNVAVSSDFALPSDGYYVLGVVNSATLATSARVQLTAYLQAKN